MKYFDIVTLTILLCYYLKVYVVTFVQSREDERSFEFNREKA